MPEIVVGFKLSLVGPGAYPTAVPIGEIEPQAQRWPDHRVDFYAPYSQVLLLSSASLMRLRLKYLRRPEDDYIAVRNFWNAAEGMAGTFPFTHPVEGWTRRMRFATDVLVWEFESPGKFYTFSVDLEEAP